MDDIILRIVVAIGLIGVAAFAVYLTVSHEKLKKTLPVKTAMKGYSSALGISLIVLFIGLILMLVGFVDVFFQYVGWGLFDVGLILVIYNIVGYLDVKKQR